MAEDEFYIADLLFRHFGDGLPKEEQEILDNWVVSSSANQDLMAMLEDTERFMQRYRQFLRINPAVDWDALRERHSMLHPVNSVSGWMLTWSWITRYRKALLGSMAVILITSAAIFIISRLFSAASQHLTRPLLHVALAPPGNYASLQLADSSRYDLATHSPGPIRAIGCIDICKCTDSTVAYLLKPGCLESHPAGYQFAYNILSTPRGGRYTAILQDNSTVLLNAASSLCFPVRFDSSRREVYLRGEGYFKVAPAIVKGRSRGSFIVHVYLHRGRPASPDTGMLTITSLGTRFNVKAYPGEGGVRVTLDEDSLRLEKDGHILTLHPGQAAIVDENGVLRGDSGVVAAGTSWKNEEFIFGRQPLEPILTELSRWYDAQVVYIGGKLPGDYTLKGSRHQSLNELLEQLKKEGGFYYQVKADTVYVFNRSNSISIKP
ncbi:MAG TPA: FecR domain-containing protein [Puia sp.]|nr:FecR domain-containing protein [Puia sp.]